MGCCQSLPSSSSNLGSRQYQLQQHKDDHGGPLIYVENLPWNTSASQIEQEFRKFGKIKSGKINVRREGSNACAFVEFETRASASKAIQASPLVIRGRRVIVVEKRSSSCNCHVRGNAREERCAARSNDCITPCNSPIVNRCNTSCHSPNVDDCNASWNSPNTDELEQSHEFSFPILT